MKLFYDFETTGLPDWHTPSDDPIQPHILQMAAVLTEDDLAPISSVNLLVKPDGWEIPDEITVLTGITPERAASAGLPEKQVAAVLLNLWRDGAGIERIAHNEPFDARIMRIALKRYWKDEDLMDRWKTAPRFCTLNKSKALINLPPTDRMVEAGVKGPKSPSLAEAHLFFTGKPLENAHDAMGDVVGLIEVYRHLQERLAAAA
jgi:DNA polymerase-3 subunit epsilon